MLSLSLFHPISFSNKHLIDEYLSLFPQAHSEYSTVTILSWESYSPGFFAEYKNHLFIMIEYEGQKSLHFPLGEFDPELIHEFLSFAQSINAPINVFDEETMTRFHILYPELPFSEVRGYFEYCYKSEELANLNGKKYLKIRSQLNKFNKLFQYSVEPITKDNRGEALNMIQNWIHDKKSGDPYLVSEEFKAVQISFQHWNELSLEGILIRLSNGTVAAVSIWENSIMNTVLVHYEKGLRTLPGIYKIINHETALILKNRYIWINRESDMNEPGLRESKLRYHPEKYVKAYLINCCIL